MCKRKCETSPTSIIIGLYLADLALASGKGSA